MLPLVVATALASTARSTTAPAPPSAESVQMVAEPLSASEAPPAPSIPVGFVQYGVALAAESVAAPGPICPSGAPVPCILGSGGGLIVRIGYRQRGPWYVNGAYEFSKQDSNNLLRLGILQQLRAEARYLLDTRSRYEPYVTAGLGGAIFGNEWGLDTYGASGAIGLGVEVQLSRTALVGAALVYRPILMHGWNDRAGQHRPTGLVSMMGFEITLEEREPISN